MAVHSQVRPIDERELARVLAEARIAKTPRAAALDNAAHNAAKPDIADSLLTARCLQDVRTLLDTFQFTVPSKEDLPHDQS